MPRKVLVNRKGVTAVARRERVAPTAFGRFMASSAGRYVRMAIGIALILSGLVVGGGGGWVLAGFGVLLVAVGLFDFCVITGLIDNIWSGARCELAVVAGHREPCEND